MSGAIDRLRVAIDGRWSVWAATDAADVAEVLAEVDAHRTRADAAEAEVARLRAAREVVLPLHRDHLREQRDTARAEVAALRASDTAAVEAMREVRDGLGLAPDATYAETVSALRERLDAAWPTTGGGL